MHERWQAWLKAKFPPDGQMVRRKRSRSLPAINPVGSDSATRD